MNELNQEVLNPVDGSPETDPLRRYAIVNGHWYRGKNGKFQINWNGIKRNVYPHWEIPRYFGFDEEEQQIYFKLCSESFYPLRSVAFLLGLKKPSQGVKFCFDYQIPIYRVNKILYVFSGDIVRAIKSCRVDYSDPVVRAVVEKHQARRWDGNYWLKQKRSPAIRQESTTTGTQGETSQSNA